MRPVLHDDEIEERPHDAPLRQTEHAQPRPTWFPCAHPGSSTRRSIVELKSLLYAHHLVQHYQQDELDARKINCRSSSGAPLVILDRTVALVERIDASDDIADEIS